MPLLSKKPRFAKNMLKTMGVSMFAAIMMAVPAFALDKSEAEGFTDALIVELGTIANDGALGDGALGDDARDRAYRGALQSRLATESIGKFLFKSVPADLPTEAQIAAYNELFPKYIAAAFASQIGGLAERQINVTESRARGEDEVIVRSVLVNKSGVKKASIDWRIREIDGQPRLLDVLVERVSPLVTKRQEFSSLAKREGVDALLTHMKTISE